MHEKGAVIEVIEDEMGIELDAKGNFHAQVNNSKEYGRDVYFVGGWLYQRPRYGKFHRRRPADDGEPARIRTEVFGTVGATLDLLSPGVALADGGEVTVAGRKGRLVKLSRAREPRKPPKQTLTQRKWRESAIVRDVNGEVVLDTKTGVMLRAVDPGRPVVRARRPHLRDAPRSAPRAGHLRRRRGGRSSRARSWSSSTASSATSSTSATPCWKASRRRPPAARRRLPGSSPRLRRELGPAESTPAGVHPSAV